MIVLPESVQLATRDMLRDGRPWSPEKTHEVVAAIRTIFELLEPDNAFPRPSHSPTGLPDA